MDKNSFQGIVLAGGKSERFGEDKATFLWRGKTFLKWTVDTLNKCGLPVSVVVSEKRKYVLPGVTLLCDLVDSQGPLGGLWTACRFYPDKTLFVVTCDMPGLSTKVVKAMLAQYDGQSEMAVVQTEKRKKNPFPGLYQSTLERRICELLSQKKNAMRLLFEVAQSKQWIVLPKGMTIPPNINTKKDLD